MSAVPIKPGVRALRAAQRADRWVNKKPLDHVIDPTWNRLKAEEARAEADALIRPSAGLLRAGGEVVASVGPEEVLTPARNAMFSSFEEPNMIGIEASEQRLEAAYGAGVLQASMDAVVSAQATNSIEKMLCHQLAGVHFAAMRLLSQSANPMLPAVEAARLTNAAARLMDVYHAGTLALQKLKTNGTQRVLVQYQQVNVGPGGQAVVARKIGMASRGKRRRKVR